MSKKPPKGEFVDKVIKQKLGKKLVLLAPNVCLTEEMFNNLDHVPDLWLVSTKLDGWRCLITGDGVFTRSGETIPNPLFNLLPEIRSMVQYCKEQRVILDGEIVGFPFNELSGLLRRQHTSIEDAEKIDKLTIGLFDCVSYSNYFNGGQYAQYWARQKDLSRYLLDWMRWSVGSVLRNGVFWTIQQHGVRAWHEIETWYDHAIEQGHEGLIVRSSEGGYKHGRATINQAIIFKMKPEETVDAQIIEVVPRKERIDTAHGADNSRFSLFRAERRTHRAAAFKAVEAAGSFKVRTADGLEFFTSLGKIDKTERARLWEDRDNLLGRWVEIECMGYGAVTAPRHPRVKRFRPDKDK